MMKRRTMLAAGGGMLLMPALIRPAAAQAAKMLKLGSIGTTSGPNASMGREGLNGVRFAVSSINDAGGFKIGNDTYKIDLINIDDESKAEKAVAATERLITSEHVPVIFGPPASTTTLAMLPTAEHDKVVTVSYIAAAPAVTAPDLTYSFRSGQNAVQSGPPAVAYLAKQGVKSFAYIGRNDDWGRSAGKAVSAAATKLGIALPVEEYFDPGTTDFYGPLTKAKYANPAFVLSSTIIEDGVPLIKQFHELQISGGFLNLGSIWASPNFIKAAGAAADGASVTTGGSTSDTPEITKYNDTFAKATGAASQTFDKSGYDAVMLIVAAMQKAETTDPVKLRETLLHFEYKGVLQVYKFDGSGQSQALVNICRIQGGKVTVIDSIMAA
jgi:branched-chain amino acid transport system substrate-binding protein